MKKVIIIILIIIAGFVIWKREPWVKTFSDRQECESSTGKGCLGVNWECDNVLLSFWLECPHGRSFWVPAK